MLILANSADPGEKPHHAAFHQGMHCLQADIKPSSGTEIHLNLEILTFDLDMYNEPSPVRWKDSSVYKGLTFTPL